jgi:hypothetical protein
MSRNSSGTQGARYQPHSRLGADRVQRRAHRFRRSVGRAAHATLGISGSQTALFSGETKGKEAELSEKSKKAKRKADKALRAAEKSDRKASRQMRKAQATAADVFAGVVEDVAAAMTGASEPEKTKKKGRAKKVVAVAVVGGVVFVAVRTMRGHRQPNPLTAPVRPIPRPVEQPEDNGRAGAATAEEA